MSIGISLSLIFFLFPMPTAGQVESNVFYVESLKQGTSKIQEQKLVVELGRSNHEFQKTVYDSARKPRYILQIRHHPFNKDIPDLYESWSVDLCDFKKPNRKTIVSKECLSFGARGVGDYFPKEAFIGWLYPLEKPELGWPYPLLAKRIIKVDGFYCVIQVTSYKMSQENPKAVESLTVKIELTNDYEVSKTAA